MTRTVRIGGANATSVVDRPSFRMSQRGFIGVQVLQFTCRAYQTPPNLVVNGGGEVGTVGAVAPGWTAGTVSALVAADYAKFGGRSLKVGSNTNAYAYQTLTLAADVIYVMSGWVKQTGNAAGPGRALLNMEPVTASGFTILEKAGYDTSATEPDVGLPSTADADWTFVMCRFKVATGGTVNMLLQNGYYGTAPGTAWFDDVRVAAEGPLYQNEAVVEYLEDANLVYKGLLRDVTERYDDSDHRWVDLTTQDYSSLLGDDVAEAGRSAIESDRARIIWLLATYGTKGVTVGAEVKTLVASMPGGTDGVPRQEFAGKTLADCLNEICRITGGQWYVAPDLKLHYFVSETGVPPFELSSTPNGTTTEGYEDLVIPSDTVGVRNAVLVRGKAPFVAEWVTDVESIAAYGRREHGIDDQDVSSSAQAQQVGKAFLIENAWPRTDGSVIVHRAGIRPGMLLHVEHSARNIGAPMQYRGGVMRLVPLAYWGLGEATGTLFDLSGNGHHASAFGAPTRGVAGALANDPTRGITLNGSTQYVEANASSAIPATAGTVSFSAWFKTTSTSAVDRRIAVRGNASNWSWMLQVSAAHKLVFSAFQLTGAQHALVSSPGNVNDGAWHHAVGTFDGTTIRVYLDGVQVGSSTGLVGTWGQTAGTMSIGRQTTGDYFPGSIDEVFLINRVVTATEVQQVHRYGLGRRATFAVQVIDLTLEPTRPKVAIRFGARPLDIGSVVSGVAAQAAQAARAVADVETFVTDLSVGGGNLVLNSSFEMGTDWTVGGGWTINYDPVSPQEPFAGAKVARLVTTGTDAFLYTPRIPVARSDHYWASAWRYIRSWTAGTFFFRVIEYNAAGAALAYHDVAQPQAADTQWTRMSLHFAPSEGPGITVWQPTTTQVEIQPYATGTPNMTVDVDGVQLERGKLLTAYAPAPYELIDGAITSAKMAELAVTTAKLAEGAITTAKFAAGIELIDVVATLPAQPYREGAQAFLTTDDKLYRSTGTAWIASVPTTDLTGQITSTQITDDAISTPKLAVGAVTALKIATNTITAVQIAADTITAGQIQAGAIGTSEIAAGAVVAGKLLVTNFDNLAEDPGFEGRDNATTTWARGTGWEVATDTNARSGSLVAKHTGTVDSLMFPGNAGFVTCAPGDQFYAEVWFKALTGATGSASIGIIFYDTAGGYLSGASSNYVAPNTTYQKASVVGTAPAGAVFTRIYLSAPGASGSGTWYADDVYWRRMTGAVIIEDGAVIADKIGANAVTTLKLAAASVEADKIATNAIVAGKIAAGVVATNELAANAVTATKIAAGAVSADKMLIGGGRSGLIDNPNFEHGTAFVNGVVDGWTTGVPTGGTVQLSTGTPKNGKLSAVLSNVGAASGIIVSSKFPVEVAEKISISWSARSGAGTPAGAMYLQCFDTAGGHVGFAGGYNFNPTSAWTDYQTTITTLAGTAFASLYISNTALNSNLYIDDVQPMRSLDLINAGGGVLITRAGISVTDGKLTVTNPTGTVIIDGTSNMFKIVASGTLTTGTQAGGGTGASAAVALTIGISYRPVHMGFWLDTGGTSDETFPIPLVLYLGANARNAHDIRAQTSPGPTVTMTYSARKLDAGAWGAQSCKYFVMKEAAI